MDKANVKLLDRIKHMESTHQKLQRELYQERLKNSKFEANFKALENERLQLEKLME